MQLFVEKSKFYDRSDTSTNPNTKHNQQSVQRNIKRNSNHQRNRSCFIRNLTTTLDTPRNEIRNFIKMNRQKAKETGINSALSDYYLKLNGGKNEGLNSQNKQKMTKQLNFLKKYSMKPLQRSKHCQTNITQRSIERQCCEKHKKRSSIKKVRIKNKTKREKQLLILHKVQPLMKTRFKGLSIDITKGYIQKLYQKLKIEYENTKYMGKSNPHYLDYSIYKLKQTIEKVTDQLVQTEMFDMIEESQKEDIDEFRSILRRIDEELEVMKRNNSVEKKKIKVCRTEGNEVEPQAEKSRGEKKVDGSNEILSSRELNDFVKQNNNSVSVNLKRKSYVHRNQTQKSETTALDKDDKIEKRNEQLDLLKSSEERQNKVKFKRQPFSQNQEVNLVSFDESSCNSSSSCFDLKHQINPWQNSREIIHDTESIRNDQSSQMKPSQQSISQASQSKKKFGLLKQSKQKLPHATRKNSSFGKSELIKFNKSRNSELNDQRRGSILHSIQHKQNSQSTSIHNKLQSHQQLTNKFKRNSDMNQMKLGNKKIGKLHHRSSIRQKSKEIQNAEIKQEDPQLDVVEDLISETNFIESDKSSTDDHKNENMDLIVDQMKNVPRVTKRINVRSSNPICSILMLNQIQQMFNKQNQVTETKTNKRTSKLKDFNPKYVYIDANKSFTQNTRILSLEIAKMKKILEANNCAMEQLFEIIQDKQRVKNVYYERNPQINHKFNFSTVVAEPVFISIKKNLRMNDSDDDEPDVRTRYSDLVPLYYTEYTDDDKDWLVWNPFVQKVEKEEDQLVQKEMKQGVKLDDMVYFKKRYR